MIVPTRSPATMRAMLPSASSKTWIGSSLSMQSERAVVSITLQAALDRLEVRQLGQELRVGSTRGSPS